MIHHVSDHYAQRDTAFITDRIAAVDVSSHVRHIIHVIPHGLFKPGPAEITFLNFNKNIFNTREILLKADLSGNQLAVGLTSIRGVLEMIIIHRKPHV